MNMAIILLVVATICFFLVMIGWPTNQGNKLIAAGLFLWTISILIGK